MTRKHEYSHADATCAKRRHERRTPEERTTLLGPMLCSAANDSDPVYKGTDPKSGKDYRGPAIWDWALQTIAYHIASRMAYGVGNPSDGIPETMRQMIDNAVREGVNRAAEHRRMDSRDDGKDELL